MESEILGLIVLRKAYEIDVLHLNNVLNQSRSESDFAVLSDFTQMQAPRATRMA
jgi:hypothetical protein